MKATKIFAAAAIISLATAGSALAFHSGGVAECEGCHSMHNSFEGSANVTGRALGTGTGIYLLKAADQSGSCLNCHGAGTTLSSYHVSTEGVNPYDSTTPAQMTPGGDFSWLKKTMNMTIRKTAVPDGNLGERHGHNIVAADFGYSADGTLTTAPGGTYPAANLACTSCHDPHGKYRRFADGSQSTTGLPIFASGSYTNSVDPIAGVSAVGVYRILAGVGYEPKSTPGFPFANAVPDAVSPSSYNRTEAATQTVVAYGQGMSEWCANCHTGMHQDAYTSGTAGLVHPAGNGAKLTAAIATNFNDYVSSGRMVTGAGGFSTLAPFEIGTGTYATLKAFPAAPTAASTSNNVSCLSCHRAHATGFDSMLRYFYLNEFMTVADASNAAIYDSSTTENKINYGYNTAQQARAYNDRPATVFGPYARSYCNKCHAKD
jgi:hypothetical protein